MQHLDEGTIHSWLDGALSADEAARVEAHVKECPQCAAAVAEARGFIAASSRILTALDNAPRGVIPVAAPKKRVDPIVWRVAATLLVVAGGTLVVFRNGRNGAADRDQSMVDSMPARTTPQPAAPIIIQGNPPRGIAIDNAQPSAAPSEKPTAKTAAPDVSTATEQTSAALKVIGTPRKLGAKVTLYEVSPGDTVTLTEAIPLALNEVVVTGAGTASTVRQATGKSAAAPSKVRANAGVITSMADSQHAAGALSSAPVVSAPAPTSQVGMVNALHTITWTDSTTGNTLALTGRMSEAQLQQIRIRIERERAAAAANKRP
ncbi:MAG TPA: zf-HC2 domain-containing protein [Gemmatimonadaceae bacterium]